jgi:AraC-like DNA-binding protein
MTEPVTVPIGYVKALLAAAAEKGCDTDAILRAMEISPDEIDAGGDFPALTYGKLYQRIMRAMRDEWFGMLSGGKIRPGSFRMLCLSAIQCKTLEQAIIRTGEFCEICRGFRVKYVHERSGDQALLRLKPLDMIGDGAFEAMAERFSPRAIRTSIAMTHHFNCWLIGQPIPMNTAYFSFPCPDEFEELATLKPTSVKFDWDFNGFSIDAKYLDYPIVQGEESLEEFVRTAPYRLVIEDPAAQSMTDRVKGLLSKDVGRGMLAAEDVASRLGVSVTTLRRHLQNEGTSFQKLKDGCRMEAAFHYLSCPDYLIGDIAEQLGFDDTSAFFRGFKRWTGLTPGEYRKRHGAP